MAKLVFPNVSNTAYRDFVSKVRTELNKWKQKSERSPGVAADLRRQLNSLGVALGSFFIDGTSINVLNSAGTKTVVGAANVAETTGLLTQVDLPATAALITNAQALTGVAPSGAYTTTVTFTVTAGVISAIVLS
jgi:hypothetical protein